MATKAETAARKRMEFDVLRDGLEKGHVHDSETREEVKAELLAQVAAAIDEQLPTLRNGQGLGIVFKLVVQNSDLTFRSEPSARQSPELKEWRKAVMLRDGFACKECGSKIGLCAHHIKHWAKHPDSRFDVENGVTLCTECHTQQHPENPAFIRNSHRRRPNAKTKQV